MGQKKKKNRCRVKESRWTSTPKVHAQGATIDNTEDGSGGERGRAEYIKVGAIPSIIVGGLSLYFSSDVVSGLCAAAAKLIADPYIAFDSVPSLALDAVDAVGDDPAAAGELPPLTVTRNDASQRQQNQQSASSRAPSLSASAPGVVSHVGVCADLSAAGRGLPRGCECTGSS